MARFGLLLAAAVFLTACMQPAGRLWQTSLPNGDGPQLSVALRDQTGLVTGIEPGPVNSSQLRGTPSVQADPSDATAMLVTWLGGCDTDASLVLQPSNRGPEQYLLNVSIGSPGGLGGGCVPIAMGRAVRIHTSTAIPLGSITVNGATVQST